jgi:hypothetical protein
MPDKHLSLIFHRETPFGEKMRGKQDSNKNRPLEEKY